MKITFKSIIFLIIIGFSVTSNAQEKKIKTVTFKVFKDKNYKATFEYLEPLEDSTDEHIGTLKLIFKNKKVLFREKVTFCQPTIELEDMNNDGVKDILILYESSARSNYHYHLYLVENKNKKLNRVKGFEELCNPVLDNHNILVSTGRAGLTQFSFYRILKTNKLVNLGHAFEDDEQEDNGKYDNAIKRILKHKK
jgi:hypothetical protein